MTRFLAVIRRLFLGGTVSLLLCLFLFKIDFSRMIELAKAHNSTPGYFSIFFLASPVLFLLFTILSVVYIRHHGQFAAFHQEQSPVTSFFRCLGHDIISPFKNIYNFLGAVFNKNAMGRGILVFRFIELVVLIVICVVGVRSLL